MTTQEAKDLLLKYKAGNCTDEEKALLNAWYHQQATHNKISLSEKDIEQAVDEIWTTLPIQEEERKKVGRLHIPRIAAAILLFVSIGLYFFWPRQSSEQLAKNITKQDIAPGGNKAILTLSDGSKIDLSNANIGNISQSGLVKIIKTKDGQIIYDVSGQSNTKNSQLSYNSISTPRGGQYQVILPDGSKVWLNAASSIRFPTTFMPNERKVEITGEVYFEVAKLQNTSSPGSKNVPFLVKSHNQLVEVLGTHFNINSYSNEAKVKTTLFEGSVRVSSDNIAQSPRILKPGQQSQVGLNSSGTIEVISANTDEVIAWKNGEFQFNKANIESVMRQAERWYNVEVEYRGAIPDNKFVGTISRNLTASKFLEVLSYTGVNFQIEGKKIIVSP